MVLNGWSHKELSDHLLLIEVEFSSERTVRRFCQQHGISRRSGLDDDSLDVVVERCIGEVHIC